MRGLLYYRPAIIRAGIKSVLPEVEFEDDSPKARSRMHFAVVETSGGGLAFIRELAPELRSRVIAAGVEDLSRDTLTTLLELRVGGVVNLVYPQELQECVLTILDGATYISPRWAMDALRACFWESPHGQLTEREHEVLHSLAGGHSLNRVASRLCVSLGTVKTHVHSIYRKLGVKCRREACEHARTLGLLQA